MARFVYPNRPTGGRPKGAPNARLRCRNCGAPESTHPRMGPKANGQKLLHTRRGEPLDEYGIECASCGHYWTSASERARELWDAWMRRVYYLGS